MKHVLACLGAMGILCLAAAGHAATITTAGSFTGDGVVPVGDGVSIVDFGGSSVTMLEGANDFLEWTHTFVVPTGESVTGGLLTITLADDAVDVIDFGNGFSGGDEPEFGFGILDDGQLLFGQGASAVLTDGQLVFTIASTTLQDGLLGVRVGSFFGDALVTSAELEVFTDPNLAPVPVPASFGLLAVGMALGALRRRK